jgi:hypothetical protein
LVYAHPGVPWRTQVAGLVKSVGGQA